MKRKVISLILATAMCMNFISPCIVFADNESEHDSGIDTIILKDSYANIEEASAKRNDREDLQIEDLQYYLDVCEQYLRAEHYAYLDEATDEQL